MPSVPSYYDSVGLLAICDSIDAVNGIPFEPEAKRSTTPPVDEHTEDKAEPGPVTASGEPLEHALLAHVPVTGVLSPVGSIPYTEHQRVAYAQLATAGQLPGPLPAHTVGGVRPNVPVAHNLNGSTRRTSKPVEQYEYEAYGDHPDAYEPYPDAPAAQPHPIANQITGLDIKDEHPVDDQAEVLKRIALLQGAAAANSVAGTLSGINSASASASPGVASPIPTRAATPASPADASQYRVEVCQICGRDFKGRKAATHKQQHIRRLHPAEYTPKRGGKKRE